MWGVDSQKLQNRFLKHVSLQTELTKDSLQIGEQAVYRIRLEIDKEFFQSLETLHISKLWLQFAEVYEVQRIETQSFIDLNSHEKILYEISYVLYPKKAGDFEIAPLKISLTTKSQSFSLATDKLHFRVLPNDPLLEAISEDSIVLVGKSSLSSRIQNKNDSGEIVRYEVVLGSYGDIFGLEFILGIENASVYENASKLTSERFGKLYWHTLKKEFDIVAKESYEIPSFEVKYREDSTLKTLSTSQFSIHLLEQTKDTTMIQKSHSYILLLVLLVIVILVCLGILLKKKDYLLESIKNANSNKELLSLLLKNRAQDLRTKHFVRILEEEIYKNKSLIYDKVKLTKLAKHLKMDDK